MGLSRTFVVVASCLALALVGAPAVALDDDLMNPNDCEFAGQTVSSGTVVVQPPGAPTTPEGTPSPSPTVINGVPRSDVYMCVAGHWIWVGTALETGPVLPDEGVVEVPEGSTATMDGIVLDGETGPATDLTASFGDVTLYPGGAWHWSGTPDDGVATIPVTIGATVDGFPAMGVFALNVTNVAPTVTSLVPDQPYALVGQEVAFGGTATDPSAADTDAGFVWDLGDTSFDSCGTHTVDGTAADKDGGVSAPFTSEPVLVLEAAVEAPLVAGAVNVVRGGQVVPVRIAVGCAGSAWGGLAPTIRLLAGDVDPAVSGDDPAVVVPTSDATGDTSGVMGEAGNGYLYHLRVPDAPSGSLFTVRVRPVADAAPLSVVLRIR